MDKKALTIIALNKSKSSPGNFVLVMEEEKGKRRLPIIIGAFEAQSIAIALDGLKPPRPLTHDLMITLMDDQGSELREVWISDYREKIFYAELVIRRAGEESRISCRTSDAVALAIRNPCPIFTNESVLSRAGKVLGSTGQPVEQSKELEDYTLEELEKKLEEVLDQEDYESAQRIRDLIQQKKSED